MTYEAWNAGKLPEGAEAVAAANVNARAAQDERNWGLDAAVRHLMQVAQEWAAEPVPQEDRSDTLEFALRRVLVPAYKALIAVHMDAVGTGNGENSISDSTRAKVDAVMSPAAGPTLEQQERLRACNPVSGAGAE